MMPPTSHEALRGWIAESFFTRAKTIREEAETKMFQPLAI